MRKTQNTQQARLRSPSGCLGQFKANCLHRCLALDQWNTWRRIWQIYILSGNLKKLIIVTSFLPTSFMSNHTCRYVSTLGCQPWAPFARACGEDSWWDMLRNWRCPDICPDICHISPSFIAWAWVKPAVSWLCCCTSRTLTCNRLDHITRQFLSSQVAVCITTILVLQCIVKTATPSEFSWLKILCARTSAWKQSSNPSILCILLILM